MNQLSMFGENIALLIGILTCLGFAGIIGLVLYTSLRAAHTARRSSKSLAAYDKSRRDARGRLLPPLGAGICEQCGDTRKPVHFLLDGSRLCRQCLDARPGKS
ncbi:MAG: hypothetical protein H6818_20510 [Phycisphaerales bacterium]|nr:hypothetical protein [Phycisphaerales bacterium]MCB9864171.1 hypothetical protein [Phycisphaerales bacterium]